MAINKVTYYGTTLVDLTSDSVTPETLIAGTTAHNKAGEVIVGTAEAGGGEPMIAISGGFQIRYGDAFWWISNFTKSYTCTIDISNAGVTLEKRRANEPEFDTYMNCTSMTWNGTKLYFNDNQNLYLSTSADHFTISKPIEVPMTFALILSNNCDSYG